MLREVAIVTVGRSDYGIYRPLLKRLARAPQVKLRLFAGGTHSSSFHGNTIHELQTENLADVEAVEMLLASDSPEAVAKSVGLGVCSFAQAFARVRPHILVVLGDRFEMFSAAAAALPMLLPVAHIHGGERTAGAIDDSLRHAITKLSHLHFVSTLEHRQRVLQLGEEDWRVTVSGAPALDALLHEPRLPLEAVETQFDLDLSRPYLLATFHPVTLEPGDASRQVVALLHGLSSARLPVVFTMPNADSGSSGIRRQVTEFLESHPESAAIESFGARAYATVLAHAAALVGNSSSGILEAPSLGTPVVNIGSRQNGRARARNVIDVEAEPEAVADAVARALSAEFRDSLVGLKNPYGDGQAAEKIASVLLEIPLDARLIQKQFVDAGSARE